MKEEGYVFGVLVFLFVAFVVAVVGCRVYDERQEAQAIQESGIFSAAYPVYRMTQEKGINGTVDGGFFLFAGGFSGSVSSGIDVHFAFLFHGEYRMVKKPLSLVRVVFDPAVESPTVSFIPWGTPRNPWNHEDGEDPVDYAINRGSRIVITCQPDQWPSRIQLPLE